MPTIAEPVVHNLAADGILQIWGVPGDSLNAVTEAIRWEEGIDWILTRHEEEATFAAAAEAALRSAGRAGICALVSVAVKRHEFSLPPRFEAHGPGDGVASAPST